MHDLSPARLADAIAARGGRLGRPLEVMDETSSTNDVAKRAARSGAPHGAVWVAETQTAGRGRQGRAWLSPRGENLLFSVLLRLSCPPRNVPPLALACGLAVRDAVAAFVSPSARVKVKWPNDVLIDGRKVAGILVESSVTGDRVDSVIVGIGLNVHTRDFPPELAPLATSVALHASAPPDRADLLAAVLAALDRDIEHVAHRGLGLIHARLTAADALVGLPVSAPIAGVAAGIAPTGELLLRTPDGTLHRLAAGEVHLRLP